MLEFQAFMLTELIQGINQLKYTIMKELEIVIKQEGSFFRLNLRCESNRLNKLITRKVFDHYKETDGVITAEFAATSIVKLVSVQMILITELTENGQI